MDFKIKTMAEYKAEGKMPEVLFWVGCSCSFDDRAKKITKAICKILHHIGVEFAVLGKEESCTGDPAKRAGNEFLFQMMAMTNIQTLNGYGVKKIVTACPHGLNTLKNEYPELGGHYEVYHHTQFLLKLMEEGRLKIEGGAFEGKRITYHDPCYAGRGNGEYEAPRMLLEKLDVELVEMRHNRRNSLCCGAGGAQFFKESEPGKREINEIRVEEAADTKAEILVTGCPYCKAMMVDGTRSVKRANHMEVMDVAELIAQAEDL